MFTHVRRWFARRWMPLAIYYVLAAVKLATITAMLLLSHRIYGLYKDSLDISRLSARRNTCYLDLIQRVADVAAPGDDIFRSLDPRKEANRLAAAEKEYQAAVKSVRDDLNHHQSSPAKRDLLAKLDEADSHVQQVKRESRLVLALMREGNVDEAGQHMAAMDRSRDDAVDQYVAMLHSVSDAHEIRFQEEMARASWVRNVEFTLTAGVIAVLTLVTWYGHRLAWRFARQQEALAVTRSALQEHNLLLTQQAEELRRAQRWADEASRSKSAFLANMSHEIRTPMTAILGFAENLLSPDLSAIDQQLAIQTIRRNGEHLLKIINDILDLSKIEAGNLEVEHIPCSLVQVVAEITSLMRIRTDAKRLEFRIEYLTPVPETIHSDPTRLKQVLINLIGNAIKFTAQGSVRLVVQVTDPRSPSPALQIDVVDTGIGISAEQLTGLFQPFTQADASTTRQFGGTGLGLSISKRLAEMLGGTIEVASQPGKGTTFTFVIPTGPLDGVNWIERPSEAVAPSCKTDLHADVGRFALNCRVLLAEDGPDNQRLISFLLHKAGAEVEVVDNGQTAVERTLEAAAHDHPFDVILMDMQMPVMDGYSATSTLRQQGYRGAIIALTAHAMSGDRDKCLAAGCDDFATKPIDRTQLLRTVAGFTEATSHATASGIGTIVREA